MSTEDTNHTSQPIRGKLSTLDLAYPFIEGLAQGLLAQDEFVKTPAALAGTRIFLPTRRACQALRKALLRISPNKAVFLPQMTPLGDVLGDFLGDLLEQQAEGDDDQSLLLALQRRLLLLELVEQWQRVKPQKKQQKIEESNTEKNTSAHTAVALTNALTALRDDLILEEIDAHNALQAAALVPASCAKHWHESVKFLRIITSSWPQLLKEQGLLELSAERVKNINKVAEKIKSLNKSDNIECSQITNSNIIIAGSTGSVKATARLMRVVLGLPKGQIILPGCPLALVQDEELFKLASSKLTHPFHAFARLFNAWDIPLATLASLLRPYPVGEAVKENSTYRLRKKLLIEAMAERPNIEKCLDSSQKKANLNISQATNLRIVTSIDRQEEADIIALLLRETLDEKNKRAALITRDRQLAKHVRARLLGQWDLLIEDTATRNLSSSTAARLFLLLLQAVTPEHLNLQKLAEKSASQSNKSPQQLPPQQLPPQQLQPQQLQPQQLPLDIFALKGAIALLGIETSNAWNIFETFILRKTTRDEPCRTQRAAQDLLELQRLSNDPTSLLKPQQMLLIKNLLASMVTFASVVASSDKRSTLLEAHRKASEEIADLCCDKESLSSEQQKLEQKLEQSSQQDSALYSLEGGQALARLYNTIAQSWQKSHSQSAASASISPQAYRQTIEALVVAEAMPGRYASHPRLAILGPLEARLLPFERVILGSMVEGGWPAESESSPFLPNAVREKIGLKNNDYRIGLSALDFINFAGSPQEVYITHAEKLNGRPQSASRFVQRLKTLADKHNGFRDQECESKLRSWLVALEMAQNKSDAKSLSLSSKKRIPAPCVESINRPKTINLTNLIDLVDDPYTIYARQILKLKPLEPLQQDAEQALYGSFIHKCFETIVKDFSNNQQKSLDRLQVVAEKSLALYAPSPFLAAFWREPLQRSARLLLRRLYDLKPQKIWSELKGEYNVKLENGQSIKIKARADLIIQREEIAGGGLVIIDHKTGTIPLKKNLIALEQPQLLLGAWMLQKGAFGNVSEFKSARAEAPHASYWRFSGKQDENKTLEINEGLLALKKDQNAIYESIQELYDECYQHYFALLKHFSNSNTPYDARELNSDRARFDAYAHLARRRAWAQGIDNEESNMAGLEE